jgi:DNA-binding CsgD family transcriptional regulator
VGAVTLEYLDRARAGGAVRDEVLTPREEEIVKLVAEAHTNEEIGELLSMSKKTVERRRSTADQRRGAAERPAQLGCERAIDGFLKRAK